MWERVRVWVKARSWELSQRLARGWVPLGCSPPAWGEPAAWWGTARIRLGGAPRRLRPSPEIAKPAFGYPHADSKQAASLSVEGRERGHLVA